MSACSICGCVNCVSEECTVRLLREEVRDLKARLKAIRAACPWHLYADSHLEPHERVIKYSADLRVKNWRKS